MKNTLAQLTVALTSVGVAASAHAGGITSPGYGSQAQPRAGAFVAKANDPSAIFHNPAGLAKLKGTIIQLGINLINFSQTFQRAGTIDDCPTGVAMCPVGGLPYAGQPYEKIENLSHGGVSLGDFAVVPLISASSDFGLDLPLVFGAGIFAPGAGSADRDYAPGYQIPSGFDPSGAPPPPGRYDVLSQEVVVIYPSVAAAYSINDKIDVGARVSWGLGELKAETSLWGLRNFEEWEGHDAQFKTEATDGFIPAFGFGAMYRPRSDFEFGLNFRSGSSVRAKGIGSAVQGYAVIDDVLEPKVNGPFACGPGGNAAQFTTCLNLDLPMVATIGGRWIQRDADGSERADVEVDVQWENWSASKDTTILIDARTVTYPLGLPPAKVHHGFVDVFSFRLGGSYTLPVADDALSVRGGVAYDTKTAPVSWTRLDQDGFARTTLGAGLAYDLPKWRFEVSGGAILEGTRTVDHGGCNPTIDDVGCELDNRETDIDDRNAPDPAQPIGDEADNTVAQSPFNAGVYEQGYIVFGVGVTTWF